MPANSCPTPLRILFASSDLTELAGEVEALRRAGYQVETSTDLGALESHGVASAPELLVVGADPSDSRIAASLRGIRGRRDLEAIPLVVLASRDFEPAEEAILLDGGADVCLASPLSESAWRAQVSLLLRCRDQTLRAQSSEQHLRRLLEENDKGVIVVDGAGSVCFANSALEKLYARDRGQLLGMPLALPAPGDRTEWRIGRPDGTSLAVEVAIREIAWEGRAATMATYQAIPGDGLPRVEAANPPRSEPAESWEAMLESSEWRFRQLAESMPVPVWTASPEGKIEFSNRWLYEYTSCPPDTDLGSKWQEFVHPEDLPRCLAEWSRCIAAESRYEIEYRLRSGADGGYRWFRIQADPIRDPSGRLVTWYGAGIDIHETRIAGQEAGRLADRLSRTLESIPHAFCSVDREWRCTFANREFEELLGRRRGDLGDSDLREIFPETPGGAFKAVCDRAAAEGAEVVSIDYYEPIEQWLEVRISPYDGGANVWARDITHRKAIEEQLRLLAAAVASIKEAVVVTKATPLSVPGPEIVFVNEAFERLTGYSAEELIGNSPRLLQGPESDPRVLRRIREALAQGRSVREEVINYTKQGAAYLVEASIHPVRNAAGEITHFAAIERDVTKEKQTAAILREGDERFHLLAKATRDAIYDWDLDEGILWWNENLANLVGRSLDEVEFTIEYWAELIHPDERREVQKSLKIATESLDSDGWSMEYRFRRDDGTYAHVLDRGHFIRNACGKVIRMVGGLTDLSDRRLLEEEILESEDRFRTMLQKVPSVAVQGYSLTGETTYWNDASEKLYGYSQAEALGRSVIDLIVPEELKEGVRGMLDSVAEGADSIPSGEYGLVRKDGNRVVVQTSFAVLRRPNREPEVFCIDVDLTERKALEQQFLRAQRLESIGTLAGGIAHDMNNLLSPIVMGAGLLRELDGEGAFGAVISQIEQSAERGKDLVRQVLSFARGVDGKRELVDLDRLFSEIEGIVHSTFPKNIRYECRLQDGLPVVMGDGTQLHQVFVNLCVNARDAMPEGGRLKVIAESCEIDAQFAAMFPGGSAGFHVLVTISDEGCGMDPATRERIFEPFFTTKELGKGTGLGLSTVIGIVRGHGGFIDVESTPGKGTNFRIYLPSDAETAETHGKRRDFDCGEPVPRGNGEHILLVDDEAAILKVSKQTLEAFGYRVTTAEDGTQAMAAYACGRGEIALVLTDMMMPNMDGPSLVRALKRIDPNVRVVAASGLKSGGTVRSVTEYGVKHFLPKPYTAEVMIRAVHEALHS